MSIEFWTKPHLRMKELFNGRLKKWKIFEPRVKGKSHPDVRYLADGQDDVAVYSDNKGLVSIITSYGLGNPYKILKAISEAFNAEIWLERDLQAGDHKRVIKRPTCGRHQAGAENQVRIPSVSAVVKGRLLKRKAKRSLLRARHGTKFRRLSASRPRAATRQFWDGELIRKCRIVSKCDGKQSF